MGWNTANYTFNPVAEALIEADADDVVIQHVLSVLIGVLQADGWDTENESRERFVNYPPVLAAFREHGVYPKCGWQPEPDGYQRWCGLERNHDGEHKEK